MLPNHHHPYTGTWSAKTVLDKTEIGTCEGSESCTLCTAGKYNNNLMNGCISCAGVLDSEIGKTACEVRYWTYSSNPGVLLGVY